MTRVSAAEFNQRPSRVKRAAAEAPVIITEHDRPSFVLLTYAEYERLRGTPADLAAWLEMDDDITVDGVEFEIEPTGLDIRPVPL